MKQHSLTPETRLILATHNKGKLREFSALLGAHVKDIVSASDFGLSEPEETGATFLENAVLKAEAAATASSYPALADDSGLCVNALGGAPGLFSGRYADTPSGRDFAYAMQKLHNELGDNQDRSAYFICVLALVWPDGHSETFEGRLEGTLVWPPRGNQGHGYDPLFMPKGDTRTFAEINAEEKNRISHRGLAARKFIDWVENSCR